MVVVANIVSELITPVSILLKNYNEKTISINDFLKIITIALQLNVKLDEIGANTGNEENNKVLVLNFIRDCLTYSIKKDYGFTQSELDVKYDLNTFLNISKIWTKTYEKLAENIYDTSITNKDNIKIEDVFKTFLHIQDNLSDEKQFERNMLSYIQNDTSDTYKDITINLGGAILSYQQFKNIINIDVMYPSEKHEAYFKLSSFLLNGLFDKGDLTYSDNDKLKEVELKNFTKIYFDGQLLYLIKLIITLLDSYTFIQKNGTTNEIAEFNEIFTNSSFTLSQKTSRTNKIVWRKKGNVTVKEIIEDGYYIITNDEIIDLFPNVTTFEEFDARLTQLKRDYDKQEADEILVDIMLESSANDMIEKTINMNNRILNKYILYKSEIPTIVNQLFTDVNSALFLSQLTMVFNYPKSLGKNMIDGIKTIVYELLDEEKDKITSLYNKNKDEHTMVIAEIESVEKNYTKTDMTVKEKGLTLYNSNKSVYDAIDLESSTTNTIKAIDNEIVYSKIYEGDVSKINDEQVKKQKTDLETKKDTTTIVNNANKLRNKVVNKIVT